MPKHGCVLPLVFTCVVQGIRPDASRGSNHPIRSADADADADADANGVSEPSRGPERQVVQLIWASGTPRPNSLSDANIACVSGVCRHTCTQDSDCPTYDYGFVTLDTPTVRCGVGGLCEPTEDLHRPGYMVGSATPTSRPRPEVTWLPRAIRLTGCATGRAVSRLGEARSRRPSRAPSRRSILAPDVTSSFVAAWFLLQRNPPPVTGKPCEAAGLRDRDVEGLVRRPRRTGAKRSPEQPGRGPAGPPNRPRSGPCPGSSLYCPGRAAKLELDRPEPGQRCR
jgi:hypothetical protein